MTLSKTELRILRKALALFDAPFCGESADTVGALKTRITKELDK